MSWMKTYTGIKFYPLDTKPCDINIIDIAHALSLNCRWGGHISDYFSVAQHSYHVSEILPNELKLWGLLHDAAEAYISDIPRPAKQYLPEYYKLEDSILKTVMEKYNQPWPMPQEVLDADNILLTTEARDLMNVNLEKDSDFLSISAVPLKEKIVPWSSDKAKAMFLERFYELMSIGD